MTCYYSNFYEPFSEQERENRHKELMEAAEAARQGAWTAQIEIISIVSKYSHLWGTRLHNDIMKKLDGMDERLARLERAAGVTETPSEASGRDPV